MEEQAKHPMLQELAELAKNVGVTVEVEYEGRLYRFLPATVAKDKAHPVDEPIDESESEEAPDPACLPIPPKVLTPGMLARRWSCSEQHIRNLIRSGRLPSFSLGGKLIRIRGADVLAHEGRDIPTGEEQ